MARTEQQRADDRAWYAADKEQRQARARARYAANPERKRAYVRVRRAANPERKRETNRTWYAANRERANASLRALRAVNLERTRAANRAWAAANPEHKRAIEARRRARIAQVLATLTPQEWEAILDAAGRSCIYCGSGERLSMDHLTPLSRGGPHTAENVAPACRPCNSSKGARTVMEFLAEKHSA